ncbi:DUF1983 domain-containing protein [Photobacterium phosphoreum]|uniref:phage tail tip fiber protein n=1 Tax=Photobacterium phosphoreum TaxID=659 RepID=UPI001E51BF21|nr:DUF1983 domain-containing protein [Photobacterium phosphoreum]MCD9504515.1 DUF1983 domain-containing protein [Photobacterium phosphoreum]
MVMPNRNAKNGFRGGRDNGAIQENMELLTGQRGNGLDRAITVRELAQLGLIGVGRSSSGGVVTKPLPPTSGGNDIAVQLPHAPNGFMAYGGFGSIMLEWQLPTFSGFAHAEVWRSAPNADGSAPTIERAVLVATTPATVFGDIVDPGSTFYYWCRFVNVRDTAGPYNALDGTLVKTSSNISDIIDDIGSQMQDSELIQGLNESIEGVDADVKSNSSAINTINKDGSTAHKAMWSTKAQAGDIKAGIGILAKSDGTSQVAVSASQFFVFDPNKAGAIQPLFAIDKGKVVIPTALIESATIQILNAQIITADKVKAGISITSPKIEGAEFLGGWAKFGPGGPYSGYHTYISADGTIKTNRIHAYGGTFSNVIIGKDCRIDGMLTVNQIEGDIYKVEVISIPSRVVVRVAAGGSTEKKMGNFSIASVPWERRMLIPSGMGLTGPYTTRTGIVRLNGSDKWYFTHNHNSYVAVAGDTIHSLAGEIIIPPNVNCNIELIFRGYVPGGVPKDVIFEAGSAVFGIYKS